jgi:hypothetical protein
VGGSRRIGGVSPTQAFMRNCRNQAIDAKGEAQGQKTTRREYRCVGLGRTGLYERRRLCNGAGAKGPGQTIIGSKQLATG